MDSSTYDLAILGGGFSARLLVQLLAKQNYRGSLIWLEKGSQFPAYSVSFPPRMPTSPGFLCEKVYDGSFWVRSEEQKHDLESLAMRLDSRESMPEHCVQLPNRALIQFAKQSDGSFRLWFEEGNPVNARRLVFASGGSRNHALKLLENSGHPVNPVVPLYLTFKLRGSVWKIGKDVSLPVVLSWKGLDPVSGEAHLSARGLGGKAVESLGAQIAHSLAETQYRGDLRVDWLPSLDSGTLRRTLESHAKEFSKQAVGASCPDILPQGIWPAILGLSKWEPKELWRMRNASRLDNLVHTIKQAKITVSGHRLSQNERVWGGGLDLDSWHPSSLESRKEAGLYAIGEILHVHPQPDGVASWVQLLTAAVVAKALE